MSVRFQRLIIIIISLIFLVIAIMLILTSSRKNLIFFYTPSELFDSNFNIDDNIRIGGFVKRDSLKVDKKNNYSFVITDNNKEINITYTGILPDLFKENQGAVIEGIIKNNTTIKASKVFAKHDENYMPLSIKNQLKDANFWKQNY